MTGSYNGIPLSWYTTNNGATYTAVYTVAAGQSNETYPLQISGITLTDQYGNNVGPFSGSDVQKTISATAAVGPVTIYQAAPITTPTVNATPSYGFVSTAAGTIHYGGDCSSPTTAAASGLNTIVFNALANGAHSNCTITVTDVAGNTSNQLVVSPFAIGTVVAVPTSTNSTVTSQIQALQNQLTQLQSQAGTTATAASSYNFTEFLTIGSQDAQVTALQERLTTDGLYSGPITGYYGALTEAGVMAYQKAHGINQLGYVGPGTRAALNAGD